MADEVTGIRAAGNSGASSETQRAYGDRKADNWGGPGASPRSFSATAMQTNYMQDFSRFSREAQGSFAQSNVMGSGMGGSFQSSLWDSVNQANQNLMSGGPQAFANAGGAQAYAGFGGAAPFDNNGQMQQQMMQMTQQMTQMMMSMMQQMMTMMQQMIGQNGGNNGVNPINNQNNNNQINNNNNQINNNNNQINNNNNNAPIDGGKAPARPNGLAEIIKTFGQAGTNQTTTKMPAGPGGKMINVTCNKQIADRMKAAFEEVKAKGLSDQIHSFDGSYNNRAKRGGSSKSTHAWGIAFDVNASENPMGSTKQTAGQRQLAAIFEKYGFYQLPNDPMHFQYCRGY
jgi:hypothetical protein